MAENCDNYIYAGKYNFTIDGLKSSKIEVKNPKFELLIENGKCNINISKGCLFIGSIVILVLNIDEILYKCRMAEFTNDLLHTLFKDNISERYFEEDFDDYLRKFANFVLYNFRIEKKINRIRLKVGDKIKSLNKKKNLATIVSSIMDEAKPVKCKEGEECPICFEKQYLFIKFKCDHTFCVRCIISSIHFSHYHCYMCKRFIF